MAFTRTINVIGTKTLSNVPVNFSFNYSDGEGPVSVGFNFQMNEMSTSGLIELSGIVYYMVNSGIAPNDLLTQIETEGIYCLNNYETV